MATAIQGPTNGQFLRFAQLVVSKGTQGLDLSALRFRFEVRASDAETPNTLTVRVYNLAPKTVNSVVTKYDSVTLTAGYQNGNKGNIFQGNIKQFKFGKERNVDSYLEILAGDGDLGYNSGVVNTTIPDGTTGPQELSTYAAAMSLPVAKTADGYLTTGGIIPNPRGKVAYGMARDYVRDMSRTAGCRWSIQNGVLTLVPNSGYLPGTVVQINSATGMIGTPESTDQGITIRCLLNPLIKIGQAVQINNADINQTKFSTSNPGQFGLAYGSRYYPATTTDDGLYRVLVAEHVGDLRGSDFYTELTCLTIDRSAIAAGKQPILSQG